jgi:hypothetical protein
MELGFFFQVIFYLVGGTSGRFSHLPQDVPTQSKNS